MKPSKTKDGGYAHTIAHAAHTGKASKGVPGKDSFTSASAKSMAKDAAGAKGMGQYGKLKNPTIGKGGPGSDRFVSASSKIGQNVGKGGKGMM